MRKQGWILATVLCSVLCMSAPQSVGQPFVQAGERHAKQAGVWELASRGNMVYQDGGNRAGIYAADFSLLQKRLSSVSGEIFDPDCYDHAEKAGNVIDMKYDLDCKFAEEEETVTFGTKGLPEMLEKEPAVSEAEKTMEVICEEPVTPEPEEEPEIMEEEAAITEPEEQPEASGEEAAVTEPEEQPAISVSGNDCNGGGTQGETEEMTEEIVDRGGEDL